MVGLTISSAFEHELPSAGLVRVQDAETGATRWVDTSSARVRDRLCAALAGAAQRDPVAARGRRRGAGVDPHRSPARRAARQHLPGPGRRMIAGGDGVRARARARRAGGATPGNFCHAAAGSARDRGRGAARGARPGRVRAGTVQRALPPRTCPGPYRRSTDADDRRRRAGDIESVQPRLEDRLGEFDVLSIDSTPTARTDAAWRQTWRVTLAAFDKGQPRVPRFALDYTAAGGQRLAYWADTGLLATITAPTVTADMPLRPMRRAAGSAARVAVAAHRADRRHPVAGRRRRLDPAGRVVAARAAAPPAARLLPPAAARAGQAR